MSRSSDSSCIFTAEKLSEQFRVPSPGEWRIGDVRILRSVATPRRRARRLRQFLRHECLSVAMALAEGHHHAAPTRQKMARAGSGYETNYTATIRKNPPSELELFELFDEELARSRPDRHGGVRPQERVQRHTVEQIVDAVPGLPTLEAPVPLMVEQLVDVLQFFDALLLVAEQVIDVPQDHSRGHPDANPSSRPAAGGTVGGSANNPVFSQAES